jgi:hypothetical protein
MPALDLGTWRAVHPAEGAGWLSALTVPWWIAGGWALDLFLSVQIRAHEDLDIGVLRRDVLKVLAALPSARRDGNSVILLIWTQSDVPSLNRHSFSPNRAP